MLSIYLYPYNIDSTVVQMCMYALVRNSVSIKYHIVTEKPRYAPNWYKNWGIFLEYQEAKFFISDLQNCTRKE